MSQNGIVGASRGQKRAHGDAFDPLTSPISLKSTPPYDSTKEQTPFSVIQSKEYTAFKSHEEHIKRLFTEPFKTVQHIDKFLQGLRDTINERIAGHERERIIVGLTGPMGAGKSATLNSLLGIPIAREGDTGESCTLASCMYQGPKRDQQAAFQAEVNFFSRSDSRDILADYLADYYDATHDDIEDEEPNHESRLSADKDEENLDMRNEAITALLSLFGNQRECRTKQALQEFLNQAESPRDENILERLYSWCDTLIWKATGGKSVVTISASTPGELSQKLGAFTAYGEDDSGGLAVSLTPMVALINFYFDSPLSRLGISFLDTPGTSDCNKARKKSAESYRKLRTHNLVLSDASRVKDDSGISKEVRGLRNRGSGRSVVVITRNDLIQDTTIPSGHRTEKERITRLKKVVERIENALNTVEIQESDAVDNDDMEKIMRLTQDKRQLEVRLRLAKGAEIDHRIWMRSESNEDAVGEKLRDAKLSAHIFSISNTEYAKHLAGYTAKNAPVLSVERTQIPPLRRHISTFPNEARLNEIQHQQAIELPGVVSLIRLFIENNPSECKELMERHVIYPVKSYATDINADFRNLDEELAKPMEAIGAQELIWTKLAGGLCDEWAQTFTTPVFLNLLKRDGRRKGNCKVAEVNLSATLIHINSANVDDLFQKMGAQLRLFEGSIVEHMQTFVSDMTRSLKEDVNAPLMSLEAFYDYAYSQKARLPLLIRAAFDQIIDRLDKIRTKLTSEEEDAYLVQAMLPIYDQVRQLKGGKDQKGQRPKGGWPAYRKLVFKSEVTKLNGVWASVYTTFVSEVKALLETEREHLKEAVGKVFSDLYNGFNSMCQVDKTANPDTAAVLEQLKRNCLVADEILNGPMQQTCEALRTGFSSIGVDRD